MRAWWALQDQLCPLCGRPKQVHDIDEEQVHVGYDECPYTVAMLRAQTAKRIELDEQREAARKADKADPEGWWPREQALTWTAWTATEGPPPT